MQKALEEQIERAGLTAAEVMRSLARDLRFDPAQLYDEGGRLKDITELDEDTRLALRGVEVDEIKEGRTTIGETVKVKFPEKTAAREQAMKHFRLYPQPNGTTRPPSSIDARTINFFNITPEQAARTYRDLLQAMRPDK